MIEIITEITNLLNKYVWAILVYILIGVGLYFTIRTRFVQIRLFKQSFIRMAAGKRKATDAISPFQAFVVGLASRVGTGNVAGVAIAIAVGGPGAVFWMWITALIGMSTAFIESTLGQLYKVQNPDGSFRGGPAYYITDGLGQRWLGVIFALSLIFCFGLTFEAVQANTIVAATNEAWGWTPELVGVGLVIITAPIIFGGIKRVARISEAIVPIMALIYLCVTIYVIATNYDKVPAIFGMIFSDAFNFKSAGGGLFGVLTIAMLNGIKRGLFSNEAGMGSAPNAAAASDAFHPANQGLIQMLGVFVDTIVVCSCTAFLILISGVFAQGDSATGVALTQQALDSTIGSYGSTFLAVLLILFCYSSVIGNYAYAESNVQFIKNSPLGLTIFRVLVLVMVYFGSVQGQTLIWDMADASMGIMALINLIAILALSPMAFLLLKDYEKQVRAGKDPEFDINQYPELKKKITNGIWEQ